MPRDETMDPEMQDGYKVRVLRCHACAARERRAKQLAKQEHDDAGLMFAVEPRD